MCFHACFYTGFHSNLLRIVNGKWTTFISSFSGHTVFTSMCFTSTPGRFFYYTSFTHWVCFVQGHFSMQTRGAGIWTTNFLVSWQSNQSAEPQQRHKWKCGKSDDMKLSIRIINMEKRKLICLILSYAQCQSGKCLHVMANTQSSGGVWVEVVLTMIQPEHGLYQSVGIEFEIAFILLIWIGCGSNAKDEVTNSHEVLEKLDEQQRHQQVAVQPPQHQCGRSTGGSSTQYIVMRGDAMFNNHGLQV